MIFGNSMAGARQQIDAPPENQGVFWRGANGQVYVKGHKGVNSAGNYDSNTSNYWGSRGYTEIADPSAPVRTSSTGTENSNINDLIGGGGGGGAGGGSQFVDTSAARNDVMSQLGSLDKQLANMNQTAQDEYDALIKAYAAENADNLENFNSQVARNESTRSGGISQSLAAAAQGGRGLRAALAAMGALGGTGSVLANRAIASSANKDVGGVNETFDTNATGLNTAWRKTEREQRQREADAEAALKNARLKNEGSIASQRQNLYKDMAGYWEQAGNKSEASNWLAKRSGQNPAIERASLAATPSFQRASASFSPAALKNYLAGNQDMSVEAQVGNSGVTMNSPLYATSRRREEYA